MTSFIVGGMFGSHLLVGVHLPAQNNILATTGATNWDAPLAGVLYKLFSFKTTGLFGANDVPDTANFRDSFIVAQRLGTMAITGLDTTIPTSSASFSFGVGFRGSVGAGPKITVSFSNGGADDPDLDRADGRRDLCHDDPAEPVRLRRSVGMMRDGHAEK